jgi:hypothetical protein
VLPGCLHDGRMSLVPAEAAELRRIAAARLAGASWRSEVLRLDVAGVVSTTGRPWTIGTLRRTITSPYVAGLRAYKGEVVGPAAWPPILDRETWDQLRADKAASHRAGRSCRSTSCPGSSHVRAAATTSTPRPSEGLAG